jgi:hypothetical protein
VPSAIQTARSSESFEDVLDVIEARLVARVDEEREAEVAEGRTYNFPVRVCAAPHDRISEYLAQPGIVVRVRQPEPFALSGAGRYGFQVIRKVDVFVVSTSLVDVGGRDDKATRQHVRREELVVDALCLQPPVGTDYNLRAGTTIHWVPGGEDIARTIKTDPGLLRSCLVFQIQYTAPTKVKRETF